MTKLALLCRLLLLIGALTFTALTLLPSGTASANDPGGDCAADCHCTPGLNGCCLLPNGAECLRGR